MIGFSIIQEGKTLDLSELVSDVKWIGRKGAAGRQVIATLLDAPEFKRSNIDVYKGCQCIVTWKQSEIFRGLVMDQSRGKSKKLQISARDNLIYFANNDDTFNYKSKTARDIFLDICSRFKVSYDTAADTGYVIPSLAKENGKLWDVIIEALSLTFKATGNRYYLTSNKGKISLILRKENVQQWIIEDGANLIDYDYTRSIENIISRVKMISDNGSVVAEAVDSEIEKRLGIFQKVIQKENDLNSGQLQEVTNGVLKIESSVKESLVISGLGIPAAIAGTAIYIIIPDIDIKRSYYIDQDTHSFKGNYHEMRLTLNKTKEF